MPVLRLITRESEVPYYQQLFEILRARIVDGTIAADERVASESELCREFGLSRATVRQTLLKLETEGFARRVAHRGVFASARREDPGSGWVVQDTASFLESQLRHGGSGIATEVVEAGFVSPPMHVAEALGVAVDDEVFALERLRFLHGKVAMLSTNWFPRPVGELVRAADDVRVGSASLNNTLRLAGFLTSGARRVIHAMPAPERVADRLGVAADRPVLRVRSLSWNEQGVRFDYYQTWVLTDVVALEVNVAAA